ncbi:hypothetical protein J6590_077435 [Homalodisca vitripennis]|nr:hypothetical protein J6590_077435 [Homalodisca vitripennis]
MSISNCRPTVCLYGICKKKKRKNAENLLNAFNSPLRSFTIKTLITGFPFYVHKLQNTFTTCFVQLPRLGTPGESFKINTGYIGLNSGSPKATVPGPQAGVPDSAQEITGGCGESARAATSRWMSGEGEAGAVTAGAGLGPGHVPPNLGLMADPCRTGGPSFLPSVRVVIRLPFFIEVRLANKYSDVDCMYIGVGLTQDRQEFIAMIRPNFISSGDICDTVNFDGEVPQLLCTVIRRLTRYPRSQPPVVGYYLKSTVKSV